MEDTPSWRVKPSAASVEVDWPHIFPAQDTWGDRDPDALQVHMGLLPVGVEVGTPFFAGFFSSTWHSSSFSDWQG